MWTWQSYPRSDELYHGFFSNAAKRTHKYIAKIGKRYFYDNNALAAAQRRKVQKYRNDQTYWQKKYSNEKSNRDQISNKGSWNKYKRFAAKENMGQQQAYANRSRRDADKAANKLMKLYRQQKEDRKIYNDALAMAKNNQRRAGADYRRKQAAYNKVKDSWDLSDAFSKLLKQNSAKRKYRKARNNAKYIKRAPYYQLRRSMGG